MTKKEIFKEEFFKADGEKKVDRIILFIHMPDDSEEVIVNSKPFEKVKYIEGAYTEELVHKNNEQIYIRDYIFSYDEESMDFGEALDILKEGGIVTRKGWNGKGSSCTTCLKETISPVLRRQHVHSKGNLFPMVPTLP